MLGRIKQLMQLHNMCVEELKQLQTNIEQYMTSNVQILTMIQNNWQEIEHLNGATLLIYDNFITSITDVMNYSRKFSMHLVSYTTKNDFDFSQSQDSVSLENCSATLKALESNSSSNNSSIEESDTFPGCSDDFLYSQVNFRDSYIFGSVLRVFFTHIKNLNNLEFYVLDTQLEILNKISEDNQKQDLYQYDSLPPPNEIFGIVTDKLILRAMRSTKVLYDQDKDEVIWRCYLLDIGEVVYLKLNDTKYKLIKLQQKTPACAILCQMEKSENVEERKQLLQKLEFCECCVKIKNIEENKFIVELTKAYKTKEICDSNLKMCLQSEKFLNNNLCSETLKLLLNKCLKCSNKNLANINGAQHETETETEPEIEHKTESNELPKEQSKNSEKLTKHANRRASSIIDDRIPQTVYQKGTILKITFTYIEHLGVFYAQVNDDPNYSENPLKWSDEEIGTQKRMETPPHLFELLLCRYEDGLWYRAKVLSHDDSFRWFKVFFVDFGNQQLVNINKLAKCDPDMAQMPFQAVLCRFAYLKEIKISVEKRRKGIKMLCDMLLDRTETVKVISHGEYLTVTLEGEINLMVKSHLVHGGYMTASEEDTDSITTIT